MASHSRLSDEDLSSVLARLSALEARIGLLEQGPVGSISTRAHPQTSHAPVAEPPNELSLPLAGANEWLPLAGRTLLVLGGGFVLRAITEAQFVPPAPGTVLGIVYALVWLFFVDRDGGRGRIASATWHGIATCFIAFPLLWEASTRFGFLGPVAAAVAVLGVALLSLAVAWRRRLSALGWVATLFALATFLALAVETQRLELFSACLLILALATLWAGYTRGFHGPARLAAVVAFASILLLTLIHLVADPERLADVFDPRIAIALQLSLMLVYVGSSIGRTLARGRALRVEEISLGLAATTIGLGGAILVAGSTGTGLLWLGLVSLGLGVAAYWAAFTLVDRAEERRTNFVFCSSLALGFMLVASFELLRAPWLASALAAATVAMAVIGTRWGRATLSLHGSVYAVAGAFASGLWSLGFGAFGLPGFAARPTPSLTMFLVLCAAMAYCALPVAMHDRTWGALARMPKFLVLLVALVGLGGFVTTLIARLLPRAADGIGADPAALAVLRTTVLAVAAVGLAWLGRHALVGQAAWLVYPVLALGGLKLVLEDMRLGVPAILVVTFVVYGSALILAPRLARLGRRDGL